MSQIRSEYRGVAPREKGILLISEIVTLADSKKIKYRSKLRSRTGRPLSKWGEEKSWRKHWTDLGCVVVNLEIKVVSVRHR